MNNKLFLLSHQTRTILETNENAARLHLRMQAAVAGRMIIWRARNIEVA